jgi:hypothetical protein
MFSGIVCALNTWAASMAITLCCGKPGKRGVLFPVYLKVYFCCDKVSELCAIFKKSEMGQGGVHPNACCTVPVILSAINGLQYML